MAKTKKVLLFIVEGFIDKYSLGSVLSPLLSNEEICFAITQGDVTTKSEVNACNVLKTLNGHISEELNKRHFRSSDLLQIVHIIDSDGAFIPESSVRTDPSAGSQLIYGNDFIGTSNPVGIKERNRKKKQLVDLLKTKNEILKKPYRVFYFSRNLEHVLHNKGETLSNEEKNSLSDTFVNTYADCPQDFVRFIKSLEIAVPGDYKKSWQFIEEESHSLERWSNFHLFFDQH